MRKISFALVFIYLFLFISIQFANAAEALIMWDPPPAWMDYEQYDIVEVQDDNTYWGSVDPRVNPNSRFIIVQLTGLSIPDFVQYFQPLWDMTDPENPILLKKRQFKFDGEKIPQNIINYINNNDGFVIVTEAEWNSYITNKEGQL